MNQLVVKMEEKQEFQNLITKKKFLNGLNCDIEFWNFFSLEKEIKKNVKNENNYIRNNIQSDIFYQVLKKAYPEAIEIPTYGSIKKNSELSLKSTESNDTILNSCFLINEFFIKIDLLKKNSDSFDIYEIKHSVAVKKDYISGMFFLKYVFELFGFKVRNLFLIQPNENYTLRTEIFPHDFLKYTNLSSKVEKASKSLTENLNRLMLLQNSEKPFLNEEFSCKNPKVCKLNCYSHPSDMDIFDLREGKELCHDFYKNKIYYLKDIPENSELNENQKIQLHCLKTETEHINLFKLNDFLNRIKFPIYYLDFETINPSTPIYQNTKPFQHVPFLYSLLIERNIDSEIETYYFFDDEQSDPRQKVLETLENQINQPGTILCFNDTFEKRCIRESAENFPTFKNFYEKIENDFLDLSIPFKNFAYYNKDQKGSASLKTILPVLTNFSHKELPINDGNLANLEFLKIKTGKITDKNEKEKIKKDLIDYCHLDTYGMYEILKTLRLKAQT